MAPRKRLRKALVALLAVLVGAIPATSATSALLPEEQVLVSSANEMTPASGWKNGGEWLAYARSRPRNPNAYDAYFGRLDRSTRPPTVRSRVKLNRVGQGFVGGVDLARTPPLVTYQVVYRGQSDILFYDPVSGERTRPRVDTSAWEWRPTVSGNWLLFNRDSPTGSVQRVIAKKLGARGRILLTYTDRGAWSAFAGQVAGDWAVWTRCAARCNVFVENLETKVRKRLAKPGTEYQYAPSVTSSGTVYLVRGRRTCGDGAEIVRYSRTAVTAGTTGTVIAILHDGRDAFSTFAREDPDGGVSVFHDRVRCATNSWNLFELTDAA